MPNDFVSDSNVTCDTPIFVLTGSRSGSTLLRFILDSHPELACPPETVVSSACSSLLRSWTILENAGSAGKALTDSDQVTSAGIMMVQSAMDQLFGAYLRRRGKQRWCDKSLDSYLNADLLIKAYPKAKFICLYRHCMDVIASGVEACPWGVHRFGFDAYAAQYPGNSVAAIGAYWASCAQAIMKFEEEHSSSCHRIRYEDMVTAPEETIAALFDFLDVPQAPAIIDDCFKIPHESNGPGDEKIWFTSQITSSGIGRGVQVPSGAIPEPMLAGINQALGKLGYRKIGPDWNEATGPFDPRETMVAAASEKDGKPSPLNSQTETASTLHALDERLSMRSGTVLKTFAIRWPELQADTFALVVDGDKPMERRWSLGDVSEPVATLIAGPSTWRSLLNGETNVITELTTRRLRCINKRDRHRLRSEELHAIAWLLGLSRIPIERATAPADSQVG